MKNTMQSVIICTRDSLEFKSVSRKKTPTTEFHVVFVEMNIESDCFDR